MSTTTGKTLNLVKPELTDDHKVTIGTDLPANFQKIDDAVSAHLAETAPHAELTDRTITVGTDKDFTTIQAAIDSLKKRIDAIITINVDAGTYDEDLSISGFVGSGKISLNGATALADSHIINSLKITNCTLPVSVTGFKAITIIDTAFYVIGSLNCILMYLKSDVNATNKRGIHYASAKGQVYGCQISNRSHALYASSVSDVASRDWNVGSGNNVGLWSDLGSTIAKAGTQPQGTTAEGANTGGVIR